MLYHVEMTVDLPTDMPDDTATELKAREKAYALDLQRKGTWVHLWRVVGEYKNISVFDVPDHDTLHDTLSGLPLFPFMNITVTPLARHPSSLV